MIKISIEGADRAASTALTSAISEALERAGYDNVMVLMPMIYEQVRRGPNGEPLDFEKKSVSTRDLDPNAHVELALMPALMPYVGYMHEWLKQNHPERLQDPVVIDTGLTDAPLPADLARFASGELKVSDLPKPIPMEDGV